MNKVLPRVFIQCKPTLDMSYMYTHTDNQLLLLCCNMPVKCICMGYAKRDIPKNPLYISLGEVQCLSEAKCEAPGHFRGFFPKGYIIYLKVRVSLLTRMYPIYTRFRVFWPEAWGVHVLDVQRFDPLCNHPVLTHKFHISSDTDLWSWVFSVINCANLWFSNRRACWRRNPWPVISRKCYNLIGHNSLSMTVV